MKLRTTVTALASAAALSLGFAGTATAHDTSGFLCHGYLFQAAMYGDGPGQGPVDWLLSQGEAFRGHQTINVGGTFWSYGHSASSFPYDYWIRTGELNCS